MLPRFKTRLFNTHTAQLFILGILGNHYQNADGMPSKWEGTDLLQQRLKTVDVGKHLHLQVK